MKIVKAVQVSLELGSVVKEVMLNVKPLVAQVMFRAAYHLLIVLHLVVVVYVRQRFIAVMEKMKMRMAKWIVQTLIVLGRPGQEE
jgi:hypothetical protein